MPTLDCDSDCRGATGVRAWAGTHRRFHHAGAAAAGREVFGYNRSVEGAHGARSDGFDAITDLNQTLTRAAATEALIVLAVPMPALPGMLAHIRKSAPGCPLTDVTSVKCAVLDEVTAAGLQARYVGGHPMTGTAHSGWTAGHGGLFNRAPGWSASMTMSTPRCGRW